MDTYTITDVDSLAALVPAWWDVWRRAPRATFFQSPAWLVSWWHAFAPGRLAVVAAREAGELVGVAPFYLETGRAGRRLLPLGIAVSDYLDVLLAPECAAAAGAALVAHIGRANSWDTWEMEELPPDAAALALPCPAGAAEASAAHSACPVLALPDRPERIGEVVSKHKLRNARQARARALRRGGLDVERAGAGGAAADALDLLVALHARRWTRSGQPGVLAAPEVREFHRRVVAEPRTAEFLRLYVVRIGGAPAAVLYGFLHGSRFYAYLIGVDPDYAFESPGTIAVEHVIADAIGDGAREFHFLRGREPYKYSWGAGDRWNRRRSFRREEAGSGA